MRRLAAAVAIAGLLAVPACSSSYIPRTPGRVGVILQGGQPAYVRDGKIHRHGMLGGGLREAVRGVPAAEQAAGEYRGRMVTGLLTGLGGLTCSLVSMGYAIGEGLSYDGDEDRARIGAVVSLGCFVVMMGGFIYTASAEPYRWDAINIFNDTVSLPPPPSPYGPPTHGGPPGLGAVPGTPGGRPLVAR